MNPNPLTILLQQLGPYGWKIFADLQHKDKAKKQFVNLFQEQLRDCDVQDWQVKSLFTPQIEKFVGSQGLKLFLEKALEPEFKIAEDREIAEIWDRNDRPKVPSGFNWNLLLRNYVEQVREIIRQNLDLREILDSETADDTTNKLKSIVAIPAGFSLNAYQKSLQSNYGSLKLNNFAGGANSGAGEQIGLSEMFVEQHVRENLPHEERRQLEIADEDPNSAPVLKVLASEKSLHAVIVGDPGAGKSTLLRYLALGWTKNNRERFPIIIGLREFAIESSGEHNFLGFLERGTTTGWKFERDKLDKYLQNQPSLVMFDELDGILDLQLRESILNKIVNFGIQYPKAKIIVTSQAVGYNPECLQKANFRHFTLEKFNRRQIGTFIDKWYDLALGKDPDKDRLKQQIEISIENSPAIRKLAENPNRLTMVAMSNQRKSSILGRTEFYEEALRGLLHKWDMDRQNVHPELDSIGRVEKQAMLQLIAYEIQSNQSQGSSSSLHPQWKSISENQLKTVLTEYLERERFVDPSRKAGLMIEQLIARHFITIDTQTNTYSFVDRTFLEYCYAKEIVDRFEQRKSAEEFDRLQQQVFAAHWQDESWEDILQTICGLLEAQWSGRLVEFLLAQKVARIDYLDRHKQATKVAFQHLKLAQECLGEIKNGRSITTRIEQSLKEKLKNEIDGEFGISLSFEAAKLLTNALSQPSQGKTSPGDRDDDSLKWIEAQAFHARQKFVRAAAVQSIADRLHTSTDTLKWLQQRGVTDRHELVRRAAVESIGEYYYGELETKTWLQQRAISDRHELVRRAAVESIGEYYNGGTDTLTWLQERAVTEQHESIRLAAIQSIAKYYNGRSGTLTWLQERALTDRHELVRGGTVRAIGQNYRSKIVLNWLRNAAINGKFEDIRRVSIQSGAKYYHAEAETLTWLQNCALCDRHEAVRSAAVRAIPLYYSTQLDILPWLQARVLHAKHQSVRATAVQSIAEYYHPQLQVLSWLKSISNTYPDLRVAVAESIAKYSSAYPVEKTLPLLQELARDYEQTTDVRVAAVRSIGEYYHTQPEILTWLRAIALDEKQHPLVRQAAVQSIGEYDRAQPDTLEWLQAHALDNRQPGDVKAAAIYSIALYYHSQPKTLGWLKAYALNDAEHQLVKQTAVKSVAQYYQTDDKQSLQWLAHAFQSKSEHPQQTAVESIAEYYYNEPETLNWLQKCALDQNRPEVVRETAVRGIAEYYYNESDLRQWFQDRVEDDRDSLVRLAAVIPVGKYYYMEPETLTWLQDRAQDKQQHQVVRVSAVESIAKYYPNPETLVWLKSLALHGQDPVVRQAAVKSIGEYYYTEPTTLKWIKSLAIESNKETPQISLQRSAVESIAKYSHQEPETLNWLKSPAFDDPNKEVRISAVAAIATYYHTKPGTQKWLKARSIDDSDPDVRTAAEQEIVKYYDPKSESLIALQERALQAPDKDVRRAAMSLIAESYRKQPKTLTWLQEQALTAQHKDVRRAAIQSIASHYRDEPESLNWLQTSALTAQHQDVGASVVESVAQNYRQLDWLQSVALDESQSKEVKIATVKSIAQHYRKEPNTLKWFQTQALKADDLGEDIERDPAVRLSSVAAISKYYRKQPETLKWFKNCAVKAHYPDVRAAAAVTVAKYYNNDPLTITWLKERALDAPPQLVLRAILESIAKYYQHQSNTLIWLKNRAVHAPDRMLRGEGILAVAKYYRHQPATYPWLKERALKDKDGVVRAITVESISKHYHKDIHPLIWPKAPHEKIAAEDVLEASNQLKWLTVSLKDPDGLVRAAAVTSLAKYYHMHPHTTAWLKERAIEDPDGLIRAAAVKSVVKYYHKHSDTLTWLKDRDLYEEHEVVRVEILVSLAKYYYKDTRTFAWLEDRALEDQDPMVRSAAIRSIDRYFPMSNEMYKLLRVVIDRDIDRDNLNEAYPKPVALKILVEKCDYPQ